MSTLSRRSILNRLCSTRWGFSSQQHRFSKRFTNVLKTRTWFALINKTLRNQSVVLIQFNRLFKTVCVMSKQNNEPSTNNKENDEDCKTRQVNPYYHLFEANFTNLYDKNNFISLAAGTPGPELMEDISRTMTASTEKRMAYERDNNFYLFQYGPMLGSYDYRVTLAKFLTEEYGEPVSEHDLVLNSGASFGFQLIITTLLDQSGFVFVDETTYMIVLRILKQFPTLTVVKVPWVDDGPDLIKLGELVRKHRFQSKYNMFWGIYYTIPVYHNPRGVVYSPKTCQELIKIARCLDLMILCDDVYNLLTYSADHPPKRLFAYDCMDDDDYKGSVISNCSFSKILFPGIRLGWFECPPRVVKSLSVNPFLQSGGSVNHYTSGIVTNAMQSGDIKRHLETFKCTYKKRMDIVCEVLDERLDCDQISFVKPGGGFFVWLGVNGIESCHLFNEFCKERHGVVALAGNIFTPDDSAPNYLRLSIAFHPDEMLREAMNRICDAINDLDEFREYCKFKNVDV